MSRYAQGHNSLVFPRAPAAAEAELVTLPTPATLLVAAAAFPTTPFPCEVFFVMPGGFAVLRAAGADLGTAHAAAGFDGGLVAGTADASTRFSSSFTLFRAFFRQGSRRMRN